MNGFEFGVWGDKVVFRKRRSGAPTVTLKWQESLHTFRPRASAVGQVADVTVKSRDPKTKAQTVGRAASATAPGTAKVWQQRSAAIDKLSGGAALVADRVATSADEAQAMARGALARNASTFLEAEGLALGTPLLTAGATVAIEGVGDFSGNYMLSATTHVFRGSTGYLTRFETAGERARSFAALAGGGNADASAGTTAAWGSSLVVALVTNTKDPEKMGRVKVKYDALGDNIESDWARVATPNAGSQRGMAFMPQPNDEVVVGFEHGDTRRPFVLGSLFTGKEKPDPALLDPASGYEPKFGVKTPHQIALHAAKEFTLSSDKSMTIEVKGSAGDIKATASGNLELEAKSSVKIKGTGSVEIESSGQLKVKGSTVSIEGSGMVEVKGGMIKLG
jgi:phage baseplate assembly protein gpV